MNKKINLTSLLFFISLLNLQAQMSYYYKGEKIPLTVNRNYVHIIADDDFMRSSSTAQLFQRYNLERDDTNPVHGMVKLKLNSTTEMAEYSRVLI